MRNFVLATTIASFSLAGCNNDIGRGPNGGVGGGGPVTMPSGGGGGGGNTGGGQGNGGGGGNIPNCNSTNPPPNGDQDGDGYTPAQGDCNDCNASINPGATDVPGDPTDYDCDGTNETDTACDSTNTGKNDPTSLAQSMELCDPRFVKSAMMAGPSDTRARNVLANFGILKPQKGANFALLSNGVAVDEKGTGYANPQSGTDLSNGLPDGLGNNNSTTNPLPNLMGASNCGQADNTVANDYTELVIQLHAPSNANSFSFQFQFFSGEYPMYVCSMFNDEFLAIVQSSKSYTQPTNISFDMMMHPITVNSGFFTVCQNGGTPQTSHCTHPPTDNNGTGYETAAGGIGGNIPGGSTGWLTTTAPIQPNEDFTLRFVIFDEGDHILDSAVLIDNFSWGVTKVMGPTTVPIGKVIRHHHKRNSLMCEPV